MSFQVLLPYIFALKPSFVWATGKTATEFREIIDHRESWPPLNATRWHISDSPEHRVFTKILGERAPNIIFLKAWSDADSDIPALTQARANTSG